MKESLKIAAVFIGTIIGAGLASGQEILQFFSSYGLKSYNGIFLCFVLYIFFSVIIIRTCIKSNVKSYKELIELSMGKKAGSIINVIMTFFIYTSSIIMISGGGAMLKEYLGIDIIWGIFFMASAIIIISFYSTSGIIAINSIIVPFSTCTIASIGLFFVLKNPSMSIIINNINSMPDKKAAWALSSILYSSMNILGACGVLCPIIYEYKNKKVFINGCTIGSIVLTLLAIIINTSILFFFPESFSCEIPTLLVAKSSGRILPMFLTFAIFLEMLSTGISDIYSLSKMLHYSYDMPYKLSAVLVVVSSIPFSFLGFSKLISIIYPIDGFVALLFCITCTYKYFNKKCAQ